jgi:hypothetical protein
MRSSSQLRGSSRLVLSLATALVLTLCSAAQRIHTSPSGGSKSNEGEIRQLVASYAKYIDNADVSLAAQIWLDSLTCRSSIHWGTSTDSSRSNRTYMST